MAKPAEAQVTSKFKFLFFPHIIKRSQRRAWAKMIKAQNNMDAMKEWKESSENLWINGIIALKASPDKSLKYSKACCLLC